MIEAIDYKQCNDCQRCYQICPMDVFRTVGQRVYLAYPEDCMTCYLCSTYCPKDCLQVNPFRARPVPTCY